MTVYVVAYEHGSDFELAPPAHQTFEGALAHAEEEMQDEEVQSWSILPCGTWVRYGSSLGGYHMSVNELEVVD